MAAVAGCAGETQAGVGDEIHAGAFTMRVTSVDGYSRSYQGVPYEVAIDVEVEGGNRFERMDFAEMMSRQRKLEFRTGQGYRERAWLLRRGDDCKTFYIHVNPPEESSAMKLAIDGVEGGKRVIVDLGR